ncbi:unnamed protein product [Bathycoccus prasinos]|mmetsp:Transcript_2648/g.9524  ORF Transcript_2648/g.9524 Transcript_2648/m.9524 type:complete len:229 (-) Transcript_2648:1191-1877(-)
MMETTTKATRSDSFCVVKNDIDEIDVAYCGPVAEIVAQKLVDLFSSSSSSRTSSSSRRRISPLKLGEIIQEEEDKDEDKEDNENAMRTRTPTTTTTTTTNPSIVVIVVETVENDEIAKEGLEVVKILLNASKKKKRNETTKTKSKRRRKYVLVGVGDSRFLAERQYFRSNQNSAEDCNAAARVLDKLLEKSDAWERVGKRLELDYGREFEGKLERWVTSLMMAKDDFP